jgi:hypothetical protein
MIPSVSLSKATWRRRALREAMDELEHAVSGPAAAVGWSEGVGRGLGAVRSAMLAHVADVEAPDGLLSDIVDHAPHLQPSCTSLRHEHEVLQGLLDRAEQDLIGAVEDGPGNRALLRRRVISLLGHLTLHRQNGADLVYDAYNVDIAASD